MILHMKTITLVNIVLVTSVASALAAETGETIFKQMCASCHGADGKGVGAGAFPPLQDSEWVKGDGQRIAQILLHGLTGPIVVNNKDYNLVMPSQGALSDEQKVLVLNYVRTQFGDSEKPFSMADFKTTQKKSLQRKEAWTAKELLKHYPLAKQPPAFENLIMTLYKGKWETLPDFSQHKGEAVEEEHHGLLSFKNIPHRKHFGVVWDGDVVIKQDGEFNLELKADDCARITIDGEMVTEQIAIGNMNKLKKATLKLKKGTHKVKVEYMQNSSGMGLSLRYKPSSAKEWMWMSEKHMGKNAAAPPLIDLTPKDGKTRIYNNFIAGTTPRTIGLGLPHEQNLAFSTSNCSLDILWKGLFISGGRHWTNRGQGAEKPLANTPLLINKGSTWFIEGKALTIQFKGYSMDKTGNPTLRYQAGEFHIAEKFTANKQGLKRDISIQGINKKALSLRVSNQLEGSIRKKDKLSLSLGGDVILKTPTKGAEWSCKGNESFLNFNSNTTSATLTIDYTWTK